MWSVTKKTKVGGKNKFGISNEVGSRYDFMQWYLNRINTFLPHHYHVQFHKTQLLKLNQNLPVNMVTIRKDFIMNVKIGLTHQQVQSQHFGQQQISLYIIVCSWRQPHSTHLESVPVLFISNYLGHNSCFVYKAWQMLLHSNIIPDHITQIVLLSDGCGNQFRCRNTLGNITENYNHYKIQWWFDPPGHGKGACDAVASVVKRALASYLQANRSNCFSDINQLHDYLEQKLGYITYMLEFDHHDIIHNIAPIKGINSRYHFVFPCDEDVIHMRSKPCACRQCLQHNYDSCKHQHYTGSFSKHCVKVLDNGISAVDAVSGFQPQYNQIHQFEVEKISDSKIENSITYYLVHWIGYDEPSWVEQCNLNCPDILAQFLHNDADIDEYEVDEILDKRTENGQTYYLVHWIGFSETTWVKEHNLNAPELLKIFEQSLEDPMQIT